MVAFAPDYAPAQTRSRRKNRAGDFFWPAGDRAGADRFGIETASGKNALIPTTERRAPSLAQGGDQPQQDEKIVVLVVDEIYNNDLPLGMDPYYIEGVLMKRDIMAINKALESGKAVDIVRYGPSSDLKTLDAAIASFEGQNVARYIHVSHGPDSQGYLYFRGYGDTGRIHIDALDRRLSIGQMGPARVHCVPGYQSNLWDVREAVTTSARRLGWGLEKMHWERD